MLHLEDQYRSLIFNLCFLSGKLNDNQTLKESGINNGAKIMVVGSTLNDVLLINQPNSCDVKEEKTTASTKEPLCRQKVCLNRY